MFESIKTVPGDVILGLIQQLQDDPNPQKVDLGVGLYRDEQAATPIMRAVKAAEPKMVDTQKPTTYLVSHDDPAYAKRILVMVFGTDSEILQAGRASATQAPGGTGPLRLAADFIASQLPGKSNW